MELLNCNLHHKLAQRFPDLSRDIVLWVIHADRIPPHLGLSAHGKYYCLKATGPDCGTPADSLLQKLEKKGIKTLLFSVLYTDVDALDVFLKFPAASPGGASCLTPISDFFNLPDVQTVHDLLRELEELNAIKSYYGISLGNDYQGIPFYTKAEVNSFLRELKAE